MKFKKFKLLQKDYRHKLIGLVLMTVATIGVALGVWWFVYQSHKKILALPPANIQIKTYSVSGQVVRIENSKVFYTAAVAYKTGGKTTIEYEPRVAIVTSLTKITRSNLSPKGLDYTYIHLSDIKAGNKIVVYYSSPPYDKTEQEADKIDLPTNY